MRAAATLVAERVGERTRCTTLRSDPPLALRVTPAAVDDETSVHLVGSAAGPVGGDELSLAVAVGAEAWLTVGSVAAATVLPSPRASTGTHTVTASHLDVVVGVREGGRLRWSPEPTILVAGCDHRSSTRITLDAGAGLVWRDVVVLGRHGEPSGSMLQRLRVDMSGHPLLRHDLAGGPRWPASQGPAGVGGDCRAVGTVLLAGAPVQDLPLALPPAPGLRAAVLPLATPSGAPPAVMLGVVAARAATLVGFLDHVLRPMR
jgi:urease accessory protein